MARKPISMRKIREILRLKYEAGLTNRQVGASLRLSHACVGQYVRRAQAAGLGWPLPPACDDARLEELLRDVEPAQAGRRRPVPDVVRLHQELKRKGVTLQLLWEEYRREHPDGYGYTQFCEHYRRFRDQMEPTLRQEYKAGEKMLVDWAGDTLWVSDPQSGGKRPAHLFVAVLGASNYTFVQVFEHRQMGSWIEGHIQAWEFFGGVAQLTVPDNEKTGVQQACRYEPQLTRTYEELAEHYGTAVMPARAAKPRDKAKVESAVLHVERHILAVLRDRTFFSLEELQANVRRVLAVLNARPFQKLPGCRRELYEQVDRPALRALPATRYELARWQKAKVNIDYHVQVDWHFYSVPYRLVHQDVDVRLTERMVEIFHQGKRVCAHPRSHQRAGATTDEAHRPKSHQRHLQWTPGRLVEWARNEVGPLCGQAVERLLAAKPHPEQGYRSCLGIMRLGRMHGRERLEQACQRALQADACSYKSLQSILHLGLDRQPLAPPPAAATIHHPNLRGADYYASAPDRPDLTDEPNNQPTQETTCSTNKPNTSC